MKTCGKCKQEKQADQFGLNKTKKDGLQTQCKLCRRETNNAHYKNSSTRRATVQKNNARFVEKSKEFIITAKKDGCVKCGELEPCALDFHHLGGEKDFDISRGKHKYSVESLKEELKKCIVVCANCHRKIHAGLIRE